MFSTSEVKGSRTCWCHGSINITKAQCLVCPVYMLRMKPLGDLESENSFPWANAEIYEHLPALSSWFLLNLFSSRAKPEYYQRFSVRTVEAQCKLPSQQRTFHRVHQAKLLWKQDLKPKLSGSFEDCADDHFFPLSLWLGKPVTITPLQHCVAGKEKSSQVLQ